MGNDPINLLDSDGEAMGNLGNAYAALGDARRAIEFYEQRLVIARKIGDRRGEGAALWNMSLSLDKLGDRASATTKAEQAIFMSRNLYFGVPPNRDKSHPKSHNPILDNGQHLSSECLKIE